MEIHLNKTYVLKLCGLRDYNRDSRMVKNFGVRVLDYG